MTSLLLGTRGWASAMGRGTNETLRWRLVSRVLALPQQLRTDLLKLYQLEMAVSNEGALSQVGGLFEPAVDLEDQVFGRMTSLEQV